LIRSASARLAAVIDGVSSRVQAVVAFNGVFDLPALDSERAAGPRRDLLGDDPRLAIEASPLHQADARAAPALLLHGTADETIPFQQAVAFQRRLREFGVRAELYPAEGAAHGFFNRPPWYRPTLERMEQFLLDVFGPGAAPAS
jgi:dipeptidyl aminopeptidase/acylaminoacyl peptidase